ncbi:AfsR/SARP family transcriptional regulator [Kitasatospora cineracea]|uniref:AfsR/SARP family transcriptional regulator n=1 Tax=Kitasatospora cineracea TaxID=88074 RepID=UPI0038170435
MGDLSFGVLGRMQAERDGVALRLGSPQQQAVLAALLLKPGRWVSMEGLIAAVWGEEPPAQAGATVRTYVWRLRGIMGTPAGESTALVSRPGRSGYQLAFDAEIDANRAQEMFAEAERARSAGLLAPAHALLRDASELWRGEPLAGVPGPFAELQRHRFTELGLTVLEERLALDVALGHGPRCIAELSVLTAEHPLRERLYGLHMQALSQAGRQAEALEVFRRARKVLIEEIGLEPTAYLTAVHHRILHQSADPVEAAPQWDGGAVRLGDSGLPAASPGQGPAEEQIEGQSLAPADTGTARLLPVPAQLPPEEADFTGRRGPIAELSAVLCRELRTAPVMVVVTGMGGAGKTALALHIAHRLKGAFPDGQLYADLRGNGGAVTSTESVVTGFLHALGAPERSLPDGLDAKSALLRSMLEGRQLLLVLDNARDAAQVRPLLPGAASCAVLATSRTRLAGLPGVRQIELGVFEPSEALDLLEQVIGAERVRSELTAARGLTAACGFLPLAVRIVAARLAARPRWTVSALLDRLEDERRRIDELRVGDLAVGACFELGYRELDAAQAEAFRLVAAVDVPRLSLASAAALIGVDELTAEHLLESLADVAMVESHGPGQYQHHDLLRAFATQRSERDHRGEAAVARTRLLNHLLATARTAFELAVPGDPVHDVLAWTGSPGVALAGLDEARAWAFAETDRALALAAQIARGRLAPPVPDRPGPGAAPGQLSCSVLRMSVDLLIALSAFVHQSQRYAWVETARALAGAAEQVGDRVVEGRARFLLGNIATAATWLDEAARESGRAVDLCRETGDTVILRQALNDLGLVAEFRGRFNEAVDRYDESIALARQLEHRSGEYVSTLNAAIARTRAGRADEAVETCERVLTEQRERGDLIGQAKALHALGLALHRLGRPAEAAGHFGKALSIWSRSGSPGRAASTGYRLADALLALGRPEQALPHVTEAVRVCASTGQERDQAHALTVLARTLCALDRTEEAAEPAGQAQAIYRRLELPETASTVHSPGA